MTALLRAVIRRDLLLAWRRRSDVATAVLFFVIVVSLFPLGVAGAQPCAPDRAGSDRVAARWTACSRERCRSDPPTARSSRCCWRPPRWE